MNYRKFKKQFKKSVSTINQMLDNCQNYENISLSENTEYKDMLIPSWRDFLKKISEHEPLCSICGIRCRGYVDRKEDRKPICLSCCIKLKEDKNQ